MENKYYIYFHINPVKNEIFYVGKGKGRRAYDKKIRNRFWKNIVNKYGYIINIAEEGLTEEQAHQRELFYIAKIGRRDLGKGSLTNLTDGGEGASGAVRSDEYKKAVSLRVKGTKASDETKALISKNHKGFKGMQHTNEAKEKVSIASKGRKHSDETKKKLSEANSGEKCRFFGTEPHNKGKKASAEVREKISQAGKGRVHSEETKEKMRKPRTQETKDKLRQIRIDYWAKKKQSIN
jgi:hypothetical protein